MSYKFPPGAELGARMRSGLWYAPAGLGTTIAVTLNRLYAVPLFIPDVKTLDRIAVNVTVASGTGGSTGTLGIYADINDAAGGYPGDLIASSGAAVATDAVAFVAATINLALNPDLYWLAFVAQTAACTVTANQATTQVVGYQNAAVSSGRCGYIQDGVTGALPSTFTSTVGAVGAPPHIQVRAA